MNSSEFARALDAAPAVRLTRRQWSVLGRGFEEAERRDMVVTRHLGRGERGIPACRFRSGAY